MRNLFLFLFIFICHNAIAQTRKHIPTDQIKSLNWDVVGTVKFELNEQNKLLPIYGESINRFRNKEFDLKGYLIPIKNSSKHQKFLLATLPINQCYFCGQNNVPIMIMIEMETGIAFTDKPIRVKGILKLTDVDATYQPPVAIIKAKLII